MFSGSGTYNQSVKCCGHQFSLPQFFYKACSDCIYSHIADDTINCLPTYLPTLFKTKRCGNLSGSLHIYVVATYFTTFCNNTCIMLRQPTWSQGRSVTLSANNLVIYNVVATFLWESTDCRNIATTYFRTLLQRYCNIVTLSAFGDSCLFIAHKQVVQVNYLCCLTACIFIM